MTATYEQAKAARATARTVFGALADVRTVSVVRADDGDGFGLRVDLTAAPPAGVALPDSVDGVPVRVCVVPGSAVAQ